MTNRTKFIITSIAAFALAFGMALHLKSDAMAVVAAIIAGAALAHLMTTRRL